MTGTTWGQRKSVFQTVLSWTGLVKVIYIICVGQLHHAVVNMVGEWCIMLINSIRVRAREYMHTVSEEVVSHLADEDSR